MASSKEYLDFILGQLSELEDITYRAMMGEFIIYYRGKIVGGIYDDRLLVKINGSMDMKKGHVVVDAKSLLGIMHLGINNEIALQMYTDDCEELCREIAKYAA